MKRLLKVAAWVAGILVVVIILAVAGLKLFLPAEKIRTLAIEKAGQELGRDVSIESIDISLWGGLGVKLVNVTVGNPPWIERDHFLVADNIDVKLQILPLISGEYRVDRLIINNPRITMLKMPDGANNYTLAAIDRKLPPDLAEEVPAESKAAAAVVSFGRLEINGGWLDYVDDSAGMRIRLTGLDISTSLESPRAGVFLSSGEVEVDSLLIVTKEVVPPLSVKLGYTAGYDLAERHLELDKADLEVNGLEFRIEGEAFHPPGEIRGLGTVHSQRIRVADLFDLMPPEQAEALTGFTLDGDFSLELSINYDDTREEPLVYSGTAVVTDLSMSKADVPGSLQFRRALIDFEPDNLRMNIEDGSFDGKPLKGILVVNDFENPVVNGELAGKLNLAYAQPFLPVEDKPELAGELDFSTKFSGDISDVKTMRFSGQLAVTDGRYNSLLLPEPVESFSLALYIDNTLTRVDKLKLTTASGELSFKGRINNLVPYLLADSASAMKVAPSVDGSLTGRLNMAFLNQFLPPTGKPQVMGLLSVDMRLAGNADDMANFQPRGTIEIVGASYTDSLLPEPVKRLEARLLISPDTVIVEKMAVAFESSDFAFSGKLIDPFPYLLPLDVVDRSRVKRPHLQFELTSHRLDIDKLFPEAAPGSASNRAALPADSVPPLILPDIDGSGRFAIDTLIYSRVEFTDISGKVKIEDGRIDCHDVAGDVYTGKVMGNNTIDLNDFENPHYVGEFQATGIEADDFVSRFSKFGGHLFGKINLNGDYDARGWEPEEFLNSLSITGVLNMKEGKVVTSGVIHSAIAGIADKAGQSFEKEQPLKNLSTNILVKDGRVSVDKLTTSMGNLGDLGLDGSYGFDGSISYKGTVLLSEAWTQKLVSGSGLVGGLAGLLSDKSIERIRLPLEIGGTMDKPKLNLDYSALTKDIGENLKDDAGNLLKGLFKKK